MQMVVDSLKVRQTEMDTEPFTCHAIYPRKLNFSISNEADSPVCGQHSSCVEREPMA